MGGSGSRRPWSTSHGREVVRSRRAMRTLWCLRLQLSPRASCVPQTRCALRIYQHGPDDCRYAGEERLSSAQGERGAGGDAQGGGLAAQGRGAPDQLTLFTAATGRDRCSGVARGHQKGTSVSGECACKCTRTAFFILHTPIHDMISWLSSRRRRRSRPGSCAPPQDPAADA